MISSTFYRRALATIQAQRAVSTSSSSVLPAPAAPFVPERPSIYTSTAPAPAAGSSSGGGGCTGCKEAAAPAPQASMLVATGNESPTTGPLNVSALPAPMDYPGTFQTPPAAKPAADTSSSSGGKIPEKDKGTLLLVLVVIVLFFALTDPSKGSRKTL